MSTAQPYPAPTPARIQSTHLTLDRIKLGRLQQPDTPGGLGQFDKPVTFIDPRTGRWFVRTDLSELRPESAIPGKYYLCVGLGPEEWMLGRSEWVPESQDVVRLHGLNISAITPFAPDPAVKSARKWGH